MPTIKVLLITILIGLILARMPNDTPSSTEIDVDQNPRMLSSMLPIFTILFLSLEFYNNLDLIK
jgi:hypothetical protein